MFRCVPVRCVEMWWIEIYLSKIAAKKNTQKNRKIETSIVSIVANNLSTGYDSSEIMNDEQRTNKHLDSTWQEFESWIKDTIGSSFRRRIRPADTRSNREMIASLILGGIKWNNGDFPKENVFIERE